MVLEMPAAYDVPAKGTIDYQYILVPGKFTEDKWVSMAEVRPGNRAVVHHVIAYVRPPGSEWMKDAQPGVPFVPKKGSRGQGEFLVGFAPGVVPQVMEPGRARLIKAGSDIIFQMHYTANGEATTDRTRIGFPRKRRRSGSSRWPPRPISLRSRRAIPTIRWIPISSSGMMRR
jgi:hypothetical protein